MRSLPLGALLALALAASSLHAQAPARDRTFRTELTLKQPRARDPVLGGSRDKVFFQIWLPAGAPTVRGAICNPFSRDEAVSAHWKAACRHWRFAYLQIDFDGVRKEEYALLETALAALAKQSGQPELAHLPLCFLGMSRGGGQSMQLAERLPARTLAAVPVCLEVGPTTAATRRVPVLTIFGERDGAQMKKLQEKLPAERKQGARWAIAVQWGRRHEFAQANNLAFVFLDEVIARRLPKEPALKKPVALRALPLEDGWLGDLGTWGKDGQRPTIAAWKDYKGDRARACWFPSHRAAAAWQAFVGRTTDLALTEPPGLGDKQKFVLHRAGSVVTVKAAPGAKLAPTKVELFAGERLLGARTKAPWAFSVRLPAGVHALHALAHQAGQAPRASRLHTIVVAPDAPDWPQANGPFGNFNPRRYGVPLVDELKDAKQLWVSETKLLGRSKGSASGFASHFADPTTHGGSSSGLIVANGLVFASSFRPRGEVWAEKDPRLSRDVGRLTGERLAALKRNAALDADDLTVALDLQTGKTVWQAIEEGKGLNRASGKRLQFHGTPVYFEGRVFSLGTMGRVYCYDAATGRKEWENDTGSLVKPATALKAKLLKERNTLPGGQGMAASPIVAGGVLVVPEFGDAGPDVALRGLEAATGKALWTTAGPVTSRFATPAVWAHGEKHYVLVATSKGALRLLDPKTGKARWTVTGLEPVYYSLAPSERHVVVNVKSARETAKKKGQSWGRVAAYRLSPDRAELAWAVPDQPELWFENHMDICAMRRVLIREGRVYYFTQGHTLDRQSASFFFHILDEASGKALYSSKKGEFGHATREAPRRGILGQFWLVEDRLLNIPDAAHSDRSTLEWVTIDPNNVRRLGARWKPPHTNTTAYEVFLELPYVNGLFLMRNWTGQVVCYDLRKK